MKRIYSTTLRLNLEDEVERKAWERLQNLDRQKYRSYSKLIAEAVNAYYDRREQLADDPYLETREKEDAFLRRVTVAVEQGLRNVPISLGAILQIAQTVPQGTQVSREHLLDEMPDADDLEAALDFADSF